MNLEAKGKWEAQAVSKLEGKQVALGPGVGTTFLQHPEGLWGQVIWTVKENVWDFINAFSGSDNRRLHNPWSPEADKNMALFNPIKKYHVDNITQY